MRKFTYIITNIIFKLFFRVTIVHPEKFPLEGPALLCANHNSMLDMFFLGFRIKRWVYWMAKEELFKNPIAGFIYRKLGAFPVKRGHGDIGSIKNAYKLLSKGEVVGIFPQGTRIDPSKIETIRVKPGAAMIAASAGVPVIPANIQGNYRIFSRIKVTYGDPFYIGNPDGSDRDRKYTKEELSELGRDIIRKVYALAGG